MRTTLKIFALVALNLLIAEAAVRVYFATQVGPRVLLYGTPWHRNVVEPFTYGERAAANERLTDTPQTHGNKIGDSRAYASGATGYSKYFPNETKWTASPDHDDRYPVRINNQGFRGEDFAIEKPPGTVRVLTLGASSTFGYHDRDDETYPFLLERELERASGGSPRFEVINFAIPHATTDNILAMFLNEGLALDPDVVTFYEGANDSAVVEPRDGDHEDRFGESLIRFSVLAALLDRLFPRSEAVDAEWWWSDELAARRSRAFLANLERLREACERRGILLIVATQQFRSTLVPEEELHGVSYAEELEMVRGKVARGEIGPHMVAVPDMAFESRVKGVDEAGLRTLAGFYPPRTMLVHARLMDDLRTWAARNGVGFVDVIAALDGDRDLMVNWVHLRAEANAIVARALADEILAGLGEKRPRAPGERVATSP